MSDTGTTPTPGLPGVIADLDGEFRLWIREDVVDDSLASLRTRLAEAEAKLAAAEVREAHALLMLSAAKAGRALEQGDAADQDVNTDREGRR